MKYIMLKWQQNGNVQDNGDGTSLLPVMMWIGIEGDKFQFERTEPYIFTVPNEKSIEELKALVTLDVIKFIDKKYNG